MADENMLGKLEGLQTVETAQGLLGYSRQSTINLLSRLKKQGYVTTSGGGKQPRFYRITQRKQRRRDPGMFDIINKYSPHMKLNPWYDHQVHGPYGPEEALVDAVQTQSFRVILASLRLFSHVRDWKKLYRLAREKDCWQQIGAMYDLARLHFRVRKMPGPIEKPATCRYKYLIGDYDSTDFAGIAKKWNTAIPFKKADLEKVTA